MRPRDAVAAAMRGYRDFAGTATRPEFWWFFLFGAVCEGIANAIDQSVGMYAVAVIVVLVLALPTIAVGVRRLHDTGRSGWWYLIALVLFVGAIALLIMCAQPSTDPYARRGLSA